MQQNTQDAVSKNQNDKNISSNVVKTGFSAIRWLLVLQLGSRLVTFTLNTAIARTVSQGTFAIANVQIQLLMNIILPLSREGFRRSLLRAPLETNESNHRIKAQQLNNFAWLCLPLGLVLSIIFTQAFLLTSTQEELNTPGYYETILMVGIASFIELMSEPLYIVAQHRLLFGARAAIELLGIAVKSILSFVLIVFFKMGLQSFGVVQLAYSLVLLLGYWTYFGFISPVPELNGFLMILPHRISVYSEKKKKTELLSWKESIDWSFGPFWATFEWQTFLKMILQEGEKILLRGVETLFNQGLFALVNVLGSLVVRFVFQWLEEGLFPLFSKLLVEANQKPEKSQEKLQLIQKSKTILVLLTKLLLFIGLIFVCFGPNFSFVLLELLYTSKYSNSAAPLFLSWYCVYILTMGVNGITEAFAHSAATSKMLNVFNIIMVLQSVLFVAAAITLLNLGFSAGLIIANCIVMATRILVSVWFIRKFFVGQTGEAGFTLTRILPRPLVVLSLAITYTITKISENSLCSANHIENSTFSWINCAGHIGVGGLCLIFVLLVTFISERTYIRNLLHFLKNKDV